MKRRVVKEKIIVIVLYLYLEEKEKFWYQGIKLPRTAVQEIQICI